MPPSMLVVFRTVEPMYTVMSICRAESLSYHAVHRPWSIRRLGGRVPPGTHSYLPYHLTPGGQGNVTQRLGPQAARVYSHIRQAIDSGELPSGTKLPPQAHLGRQHGVALLTVRQALARLQAEGLVVSIHGKGTYVAESGPTAMPWTGRSASAGPEEYYREIVETSPSGIAFTDATGR